MPNMPTGQGCHQGATERQKPCISAKKHTLGRGLKIRVSVVRFRPWAPFIPKELKKAQRTAKPGRAMPRAKATRQGLYPKHVWNVIIYYNP